MIKKELTVTENCELIKALNQDLGLNFVEIKKILRKGDVKVNNKKVKENIFLNGGDYVVCYIEERKIEVIYKDENVLIVNKPKKLETISQNNTEDLTALLQKKYTYCMPCHRLDFNTSGLCVFALNKLAENEMLNAFKEGNIEKRYLALTGGDAKKSEVLEAYLIKNSEFSQVKICSNAQPNAAKIKTEYILIEKINKEINLIEVILHTGKTHQIRAHLAFNNMPVLGDRKYGDKILNNKYNKHTQCLVSYSLKFYFSPSSLLHYLSNKKIILTENKTKKLKIKE